MKVGTTNTGVLRLYRCVFSASFSFIIFVVYGDFIKKHIKNCNYFWIQSNFFDSIDTTIVTKG